MNVWFEIKKFFTKGGIFPVLIITNLTIFVLIQLILMVLFLFEIPEPLFARVIQWFSVPSSVKNLVFQPWSIITYNFLHQDFWHIVGNMLWLFFLGRVFLLFMSNRQMLAVYLLGGISGGLLYILAYNIFPVFRPVIDSSHALGASASVTAIVMAVSIYKPNYLIYPFGIFSMKLKWLAVFFILFDLISIRGGNAGGHIAHIGGAIYGIFFAVQLAKGKDMSDWFWRFIDSLTGKKTKPKMKITYGQSKKPMSDKDYNKAKIDDQAEMDRILEKISKFGYDRLTKEEKDFLFKMSKK